MGFQRLVVMATLMLFATLLASFTPLYFNLSPRKVAQVSTYSTYVSPPHLALVVKLSLILLCSQWTPARRGRLYELFRNDPQLIRTPTGSYNRDPRRSRCRLRKCWGAPRRGARGRTRAPRAQQCCLHWHGPARRIPPDVSWRFPDSLPPKLFR